MKPIPPADPRKPKRRQSFKDSPAFGMWKDREDMKDPAEWLRKRREARTLELRRIMEECDKRK